MPARILVTQHIPDEGLALLRGARDASLEINPTPGAIWTPEELRARVPDHDYLLCLLTDQIDAALLEAGAHGSPPLRLVANMAVGYNNIDLEAARRLGILVTNTPGVLTDATADLTFALLLAVARRIPEADRFTRAGRFHGWQPLLLLGTELSDKTLGIVGMGRIGRAVARRAQGFGMRILYTARHALPAEEERALNASFASLEDVLPRADFLSLHVPYNPQTHHLLNAETLERMKPEAYLINTARGPIVDEAALVAALQAGRLRGAALDVFEDEPRIHPALLQMEQVVLAPHIGSATYETRARMATTAAANILAHLRGETPPNLVP
ncbi:MAG TPA: D-glycerate dehydrogenase [Ktedonobacterales bacterium]|nr:D-glycerate dehydrogenase [Ktedonobacterales bacterium]